MAYNGRIETGTSRTGAISPTGDFDTWNTTFISGLTYSVAAKGVSSGSGTLADPNIALYDASGNRLMFNDDVNPPNDSTPGTNRDGQLTFKIGAGATANYTLGVGEQGDNATGSYTLTVSAGYASNGNDRVTGSGYGDAIHGMAGNDVINGMNGNDLLFGGDGNDQLIGGAGNDVLQGQAGHDILRGATGNDLLYGATGADKLYGGAGADRFVFHSVNDSNATYGKDMIVAGDGGAAMDGIGVAGGDVLDLRGLDADVTRAGDQAFVFSATPGAGRANLSEWNGHTVFNGYVNNDNVVDIQIIIADGSVSAHSYTADEFLL